MFSNSLWAMANSRYIYWKLGRPSTLNLTNLYAFMDKWKDPVPLLQKVDQQYLSFRRVKLVRASRTYYYQDILVTWSYMPLWETSKTRFLYYTRYISNTVSLPKFKLPQGPSTTPDVSVTWSFQLICICKKLKIPCRTLLQDKVSDQRCSPSLSLTLCLSITTRSLSHLPDSLGASADASRCWWCSCPP